MNKKIYNNKMIKDYYSCDGGSICVKCGNSFVKFPNSIGDGFYKVYVMNNEEFREYKECHNIKYNFVSYCIFDNGEVLDDDCIDTEERYNQELDKGHNPIICVIHGRTEIYEASGKFYFINY